MLVISDAMARFRYLDDLWTLARSPGMDDSQRFGSLQHVGGLGCNGALLGYGRLWAVGPLLLEG